MVANNGKSNLFTPPQNGKKQNYCTTITKKANKRTGGNQKPFISYKP